MSIHSDISDFILQKLNGGSGRTVIEPAEDLVELGLLDSLSVMRLIDFLEDTYDIEVDGEDVVPENFTTIEAIGALVERRRAG